ncbi:MAG: hypothetical protein IKH39_02940 [Candidatus Methanomethylophilaceae archaeon]|nr:hypothetical protein [Candidatus Methanomethylophilaceae archaeon]
MKAIGQTLEGTMLVGSDSTLTLNLTDSSTFTGTINGKITNADGDTVSSSVGDVSVTLDSTSKWNLTADTYIESFSGTASNVISNGYTLYVDGTALSGTSSSSSSSDSGSSSSSESSSSSSESSSSSSESSSSSSELDLDIRLCFGTRFFVKSSYMKLTVQ